MATKKSYSGRPKAKEIAQFTRQLSILLGAGVPLNQAVSIIHSPMKNKRMKAILEDVGDSIEEGTSFYEALSSTKAFSFLYVSMIKAGEVSGALVAVLKQLSEFLDKVNRTRNKVRAALAYPAFVTIVAVVILAALMIFVVPVLVNVFKTSGGELPAATQFLINISTFIADWWLAIILLIASFIVGLWFVFTNKNWRALIDRDKSKLPVIGEIFYNFNMGRFSRILGTLLNSGMPILEALMVVKDVCGNLWMAREIERITGSLEGGGVMSELMEESQTFPLVLTRMIKIGEESGKLGDVLIEMANEYESDLDNAIMGLTSLLEPLMIVIMGIIIGFIVIALFFPLFTLGGMIK